MKERRSTRVLVMQIHSFIPSTGCLIQADNVGGPLAIITVLGLKTALASSDVEERLIVWVIRLALTDSYLPEDPVIYSK